MKILKAIFIALAVGVVSAPVLADQAGEAAVVAQTDSDNRPATLGDINRLDGKIDNVWHDLGARIDTLTTAVWVALGVVVAEFLVIIAILIRQKRAQFQA